MEKVRCRFAPSPTGYLHLGGARTALFNYLFAKKNKGTFILRIEDTDTERNSEEATQAIFAGLEWLGLAFDEGPYFQSKRLNIYQEYAKKLLSSGHAYRCYATSAELEEMRNKQSAEGKKQKYDGRYRPKEITPQQTELPSANSEKPFVIRFRHEETGKTVFNDLVLAEISTPNEELEDFVIIRSNGEPTYNFVVVVDDIEMKISHIIRGNDHVSNTPKQVALYLAFGVNPPQFAHVPMILGPDKQKLSKRHGATSVIEYKKEGYLPDAMLNYLARLGWSHGDQEIFTKTELENAFEIKNIGKSAAVFDFKKLAWVNAEHIKKTSANDLINFCLEFLEGYNVKKSDSGLIKLIENLKSRSQTTKEMASSCIWYLTKDEAFTINVEEFKAHCPENITSTLKTLVERLNNISDFNEASAEKEFKNLLQEANLKMPQLAHPLRFALTGSLASLPISAIFGILGKERTIYRLKKALV